MSEADGGRPDGSDGGRRDGSDDGRRDGSDGGRPDRLDDSGPDGSDGDRTDGWRDGVLPDGWGGRAHIDAWRARARVDEWIDRVRTDDWPDRLLAAVFGDRRGLALFLGALVFVGVYWRLRPFSTDQYAVLNALVALADGHLAILDPAYGSEISPGTYVADGRLYGRNYGHVVVTLPVLFALRGLSLVFELRALLVGGWALTLLAFAVVVGDLVDRRRLAVLVASPLALVVFLGNVLVGAPLPDRWVPLVALQLTTAAAAALLAVVLYRLVTRRYDARIGTAAGAATVLATPVGLWAVVPKRHSITAMLVVCCLFALYRSRAAERAPRATAFRAVAYGCVGLTAWVHAGEALILLVALAAVDLPTARHNSPRDLAVVGGVFALSMVPFLATNVLISGEPFTPPRMLPSADNVSPDAYAIGGAGSEGGGSGSGGGATTPTPTPAASGESATKTPEPGGTPSDPSHSGGAGSGPTLPDIGSLVSLLVAVFAPVSSALDQFVSYFQRGVDAAVGRPGDLVYTFVRSGYYPGHRPSEDVAVNLSVLESMPLLGALLAAPLLVAARLRDAGRHLVARWGTNGDTRGQASAWPTAGTVSDLGDRLHLSAARTTEFVAVLFVVLLTGVMLMRLPVHHMVTVRYLHPIYPLGLYLIAGLPAVREAVGGRQRSLVASYGGTVAASGAAYVGFLTLGDPVLGEAVQAFALVSLGSAVAVASWAVVATARGRSHAPAGAVVLGAAAGLVTAYLLVSGLALFSVERAFLLPWSDVVSDWIAFGSSGV